MSSSWIVERLPSDGDIVRKSGRAFDGPPLFFSLSQKFDHLTLVDWTVWSLWTQVWKESGRAQQFGRVKMSGFGVGKMVIGQAGKKYGLHRPGAPVKNACVFGEDDDDGVQQDALKALASDKHKEKMQKRVEKEMAKALAEDSSIFDYDGVHDSISAAREEQAHNKKASQKVGSATKYLCGIALSEPHYPEKLRPFADVHVQVRGEVRYVHQLMERTRERKKEDEKLFEKQLVW
jgi:hypothetical protein